MNKGSKLFKISGILAIVFGAIMCLGFILVFPALIGAAMIYGGISFMNYAEMDSHALAKKNTIIIVWIVIFFLFGGMITGVLALSAYLDSREDVAETSNSNSNTNSNSNVAEDIQKTDTDLLVEKIERLDKLHKDGLITDEEYESLKKDVLKK